MAKRSNDGSDADDNHSQSAEDALDGVKRRKITFESVRLPAVSNVNDINNRARNYQAAKLAQQVKYKNKKIVELERENERLRRRQETDENSFYRINRYNLEMEAQLMYAARSEMDIDSKIGMEDEPTGGTSDLMQLDPEQFEKQAVKKRERVVNLMQRYSQHRQKRSEKQKSLSKKLAAFMESSTPSTSGEAMKELSSYNQLLSEENARLSADNIKLQQEMATSRAKLRQKEDECEILLSKKEEMMRELEDVKFEADKNLRMANKFESRLCTLALEYQSIPDATASTSAIPVQNPKKANGQTNGSPNDVTNNELSTLRLDRDEQSELASKRLQEITELNTKLQRTSAELSRYKAMDSVLPVEKIVNSQEFKNLQKYYSIVVKEFERIRGELDEVTVDRDALRSSWTNKLNMIDSEHETTLKTANAKSAKIEKDLLQMQHDYAILRVDFEQNLLQHQQDMHQTKQGDVKTILSSMKTQNHVLKLEVNKYKKKWKDTVSLVSKGQRELDILRKKIESNLIVYLSSEDGKEDSVASPDPVKEDDPSSSIPTSNPIVEKDMERLRKENDALIREIKLLAVPDRAERLKYYDRECQINVAGLMAELDQKNKEIDRCHNLEKVLSEELDNIGQALEELQEQNSVLVQERRESEDSNLKLRKEQVVTSQLIQKLREENELLAEFKTQSHQTQLMMEFDSTSLKNTISKNTRLLDGKTMENVKIASALEIHRKMVQELGLSRDELQIRNEKHEIQLKHVQEILSTKSSQVEFLNNKKNRAEEELNILKKKYERVQKSEKYGSADAVLAEENRQLKERLTCPSCKTKQKDCMMLKCYHVFCESCIRTRYDTRQRKCPKCNCGFGANDFHRVFI